MLQKLIYFFEFFFSIHTTVQHPFTGEKELEAISETKENMADTDRTNINAYLPGTVLEKDDVDEASIPAENAQA